MKLTKASVARLQLEAGKTERIVFDDELAGFGVRIRAGGKRTWIAQYRLGLKQRRMTLGTVETIDEAEARKRARTALGKVHLGHDPQMEKVERRAQAERTLGSVAERYLEHAEAKLKPRSYSEVERHLKKLWKPLAELALAKVTRADVAARLAKIAKENGKFSSNRARASLSALFSWAIGEGLADMNPVVGTNKATDEISRDRVLSDVELGLIWRHAGEGDYGDILRLLMLTGQRREEVGGMLWQELPSNFEVWSISAGRTKNARAHDVPLSAAARSILARLEPTKGRALVFGNAAGPFQGWSNAKNAIDLRIQTAIKNGEGHIPSIVPWRLHDLRRTAATRMADLGVQPHVIEAILNHVSGHRAGVAGIYNRATYAAEKRVALEMWAAHVEALAEGITSKVVSLAKRLA